MIYSQPMQNWWKTVVEPCGGIHRSDTTSNHKWPQVTTSDTTRDCKRPEVTTSDTENKIWLFLEEFDLKKSGSCWLVLLISQCNLIGFELFFHILVGKTKLICAGNFCTKISQFPDLQMLCNKTSQCDFLHFHFNQRATEELEPPIW